MGLGDNPDSLVHWTNVMRRERTVDEWAIADWCTLYCASDRRRQQAIMIWWALMDKLPDGRWNINQPGAFLAERIKNAWFEEEWFGMGSTGSGPPTGRGGVGRGGHCMKGKGGGRW